MFIKRKLLIVTIVIIALMIINTLINTENRDREEVFFLDQQFPWLIILRNYHLMEHMIAVI
jgi:hypothetical protein